MISGPIALGLWWHVIVGKGGEVKPLTSWLGSKNEGGKERSESHHPHLPTRPHLL
jgi:hypothetical protein